MAVQQPDRSTVLIVQDDADQRERLGAWLEAVGYEVLACPGPSAPGYVCLAGHGRPCPLPAAADVVVLDLRLEGDELGLGTPAWRLLDAYAAMGKPVVVLADAGFHQWTTAGLVVLDRHPARRQLLDAVSGLLAA